MVTITFHLNYSKKQQICFPAVTPAKKRLPNPSKKCTPSSTAVANQVYETYRRQTGDSTPAVILSTASPYKFGHSVYQSIFGPIPEGLNDFDVLKSLADKTGVPIPKPLTNLDKKPDLHHTTCRKDQMAECISDFVREAKVNQ